MRGATGAFSLVALQLLCGTFVLMYLTMLAYRVVDRGHYRALVWVVAPLTAVMGILLPARIRLVAWSSAAAMALFLAAVYTQRPLMEWLSGGAGAALSLWLLMAAATEGCSESCLPAALHAFIGGLFLGALTHAMVLGHWYLNQPRLSIEPLKGATRMLMISVPFALAAGVVTRSTLVAGKVTGGILDVSSSGYWWAWLLLAASVGVLSFMIRSTVWERSTQSATGLMYVAMVPAIGAQFVVDLLLKS